MCDLQAVVSLPFSQGAVTSDQRRSEESEPPPDPACDGGR